MKAINTSASLSASIIQKILPEQVNPFQLYKGLGTCNKMEVHTAKYL